MADEAIKAAMANLMKLNAEKPNQRQPPNLRQGDGHQSCSSCQHFQQNMCQLYQYRTQPEQVCDSWAPLPE